MATQPQVEAIPSPVGVRERMPRANRKPHKGSPLAGQERVALPPSREPATSPPAWRVAVDQINGDLLRRGAAERERWDYRPVPPLALDDEGYLIEDAMPINDGHLVRGYAYGPVLKAHYHGRGGMVGADLSMPYVEGSPTSVVSPDLFVALDAEEREGRKSYKLWEEPVPDFILEDLSPSNWRNDAVDKRKLYQSLGVREYWMLDETRTHLLDDSDKPLGELLVGYRLRRGRYVRIRANAAGRLPSAVLNLELIVRDGLLRFFDPATGEYLRTLVEAERRVAATERSLDAEKQRSEAAERLAAAERREREAAEQHATAERDEKEAAQARVAELEAQLRAVRSD